MKKSNLSYAISALLLLSSCGNGNQYGVSGTPEEVMDKKVYSKVVMTYDAIKDFSDGHALVENNDGKYGLINVKGKEVIPCTYSYGRLGECHEGLCYFYSSESGNGRYGYVNTKGEIVVEAKYNDANDFQNGLGLVKTDKGYGFVNAKGHEVIPCGYKYAKSFSDGLALVEANGKYGYINAKNEFVIPAVYEDAEAFSCGVACVYKSEKEMVIDTKGELIFALGSDADFLEEEYADNLIPVIKKVNATYKCGFVDTKGNEVIPFDYDLAEGFVDGKAMVLQKKKVYVIDTKGQVLEEVADAEDMLESLEDLMDWMF